MAERNEPDEFDEISEALAQYAPAPELRGLYRGLTATLGQVEKILAPAIPDARRAEELLTVEGDELPNFRLFHDIAAGEMEEVLTRVCDLLREFYPTPNGDLP